MHSFNEVINRINNQNMTTILHFNYQFGTYSKQQDKIMNNLGAYNLLKGHYENVSDATKQYLKIFQLPETEYGISERVRFRKNGKLDSWNDTPFQSQCELLIDDLELSKCSISSGKSIDTDKKIFIEEQVLKSRKHICTITKESLKHRLSILLDHIAFIAQRESVTAKQIAAMSLELIANKDYDRKSSQRNR